MHFSLSSSFIIDFLCVAAFTVVALGVLPAATFTHPMNSFHVGTHILVWVTTLERGNQSEDCRFGRSHGSSYKNL